LARSLVAQWGRPAAIDTFAPDHASDPLVQRWWARMLRLGSSPRCMHAVLRTLALSDVRALLPQVRVPTLVMHRTGDRAVRVDAGRQVADRYFRRPVARIARDRALVVARRDGTDHRSDQGLRTAFG
jgi:pimeloyl-ACP methyl ester carboxylesterase